MGRRLQMRRLGVWMNGMRVGTWSLNAQGSQTFGYDNEWLNSPQARPISLSLPLIPEGELYQDRRVNAYFDNLLPDSQRIRERLQRRFKIPSINAFDLLEKIGADCVGAIQLVPDTDAPANIHTIDALPLTEEDIERIITHTLDQPFGQMDESTEEFRISLAGVQEKTALLWHNKQWHRPLGATPTTHIFKLPIGNLPQGIDLSTSVENEWLCAQILQAFNVPVAHCSIEQFGAQRVLVVERFDRRLSPDARWWIRLPQEDFCQATGTAPGQKYESEGGPGMLKCLNILLGSTQEYEDRIDFLRTQILFWMLCAIDGHAKNFSIFLQAKGGYHLTPRYDVLSAYPVVANAEGVLTRQKIKMAMAVEGKNRHYHWNQIYLRHWVETARRAGLQSVVEGVIEGLVQKTPGVIAQVSSTLPAAFPQWVSESIFEGLAKAGQRLSEG